MSATALSSAPVNPLYRFRAPVGLRNHPYAHDGYFTNGRTATPNDYGAMSIFPRDLRYKHDPSLEIDVAWCPIGINVQQDLQTWLRMTTNGEYNVALADDFEILDPRIEAVWQRNVSGALTLAGAATNTMQLMWRTGEAADRESARNRSASDAVGKSVEEMTAEEAAKNFELTRDGVQIRVSMTDDGPQPNRGAATPERGKLEDIAVMLTRGLANQDEKIAGLMARFDAFLSNQPKQPKARRKSGPARPRDLKGRLLPKQTAEVSNG